VDLSDNPPFDKVAEAFGCHGLRCERRGEVDEVIARARALKDAPVFMDFLVERSSNVYPMVPAGCALDQIVHFPEDPELV
jgi:acetolactate synthase-1/2/3 large subunit